jgi:Sulfotransferase family
VTHRFAFVLGTGRCGSTLVHEVLARHPDVGFVTNLDDRFGVTTDARQIRAYRRLPPGVTEKGRIRFAPSEGYRVLQRDVSPLVVESVRDLTAGDVTPWLRERLAGFFTERARRAGLPLFLHKFTGWPRVGLLDAVLPGARYVHVVRDGRAVANSWLQMPWWRGNRGPDHWHFGPLPDKLARTWEESGRSFVVLAGLAWRLLMDAHDEARGLVPASHWLELRYEDVLRDPRVAFEAILGFLDLPWNAEFERALGRYAFSSARSAAYVRDLTQDQLDALTAAITEPLAKHGYA